MGLYLINICVDHEDPNPEGVPEDLSYNDQESIVEIVVEQIFGYENSLKEYDDPDTDDNGKRKNVKIDFLLETYLADGCNHFTVYNRIANLLTNPILQKGYLEIENPPPNS